MTTPRRNLILARTSADAFVGRDDELARLVAHSRTDLPQPGLALLSTPRVGVSELLRNVFDRLFAEQDEVIPFYFELLPTDVSARDAALRFLREFLLQAVAFRRRDPRIIDSSPEICEIAELAAPSDAAWIDRLVDSCMSGSRLNDERFFIANCLSAPLRASSSGARVFAMIDGVENCAFLGEGKGLFDEIAAIYSRAAIPHIIAGHRRFLYGRTHLPSMRLDPLGFEDAGKLIEHLARATDTQINDQTRDLMAVQLGGNAGYITSIFAEAADNLVELNTFERVEQTYTNSIFGGRLGRGFNAIFDRNLPDANAQLRAIRLLAAGMKARGGKIPAAYWRQPAGVSDDQIALLHSNEIISTEAGSIIGPTDGVLSDYVRGRARLEDEGVHRASVVGDAISENIRRAPQMMARFYRRRTSLDLRSLMAAFDGRQISRALVDYSRFADEFKGADDDKIRKALKEDNEKFALPRITFTANTAAFYPRFDELCDTERSAIALGFEETSEKDDTVWIAAEIDSKLEAKRDLAEFWCDRLEMAALNCNFDKYKLWLIAPEGFAPDAREILVARGAFGSSRRQADLLAEMLGVEKQDSTQNANNEYEIVVPMGGDTEMIGAHALDEIARKNDIAAKTVNQIKTALVEACINAAEHSLSPDRKIYQKFAITDDRITVTVANRGVRLADKTEQPRTNDERRGWGLKLIKGLMDEVSLDATDDGTRITMVKYLRPVNVGKDE